MRWLAALAVVCACGSDRGPAPAPPAAPQLDVTVDRRVELMSIVFRLAGRPRYTEATSAYAKAVDAHFAPYLQHDAVVFTKQLGERYGIGYDMAPSLAVHLDDALQPRASLSPLPTQLERWKVVKLDKYLAAVRDFATTAKLDEFLASQRTSLDGVVAADRTFLAKEPFVAWFDRVLGPRPKTHYHFVAGMLSGPMAFAARVDLPDGGQDVYVVADLGEPPRDSYVPFIVHELCHSYTNPIVDAAMAELAPVAAPVIAPVAERMKQQAYTTDAIVIEESVVRAIVVLWTRERQGAAAGDAEIAKQEQLGFAWTRALADALAAARGNGTLSAAAITKATRETFARYGRGP
ncbi:MAG TPA: DUF4932 domain-containing protein [Kofleriaceae bacterium]|nr:DUF4932 domain-containing protein [Kofleriaceae bacterium]